MTTKRNASCPCGSGKKYKNCHGRTSPVEPRSEEAVWRRIRTATDGFPTMMLRFVREVFGRDAIHEAWAEFTLWDDAESGFDPDSHHLPVFMPWFFHQWMPDPLDTGIADTSLHERTPTSVLLERRGRRLDPTLRRYLEACLEPPLSFHEVVGVEPGKGFRARDVFTGEERNVLERSASRTLRRGDLVYGQFVTSEGITLMEACSSLVIPPEEKLALVDLRERMAAGDLPREDADVRDWELEIRELYLDIVDARVNPRIPHLQNTDGEALAFHTLSFRVPSAREAFDALRHLAMDEAEDELLSSAEYDERGDLRRVALPWRAAGNAVHETWQNTVLGHLEIDGERLVANVNSAERAERLKALVEAACPAARHTATEVETLQEALARREAEGEPEADPDPAEMPPEAHELARTMMAEHYDRWIHEGIPALGGRSPLEAVRERAGREKVEALVAQIARSGTRMHPPLDEAVIRTLRERLGLTG